MADAIESGKEVLVCWMLKADVALAEFPAGQDLGLKLFGIAFAEEQALANADLAAGPNQAFPIVRVGGKLVGQQNLDASFEEIAGGRILSGYGVSAGALAAAIQPSWKNARVVEDHYVAGL